MFNKTLNIFLAVLLFSNVSFGADSVDFFYEINDFSGGLKSHYSPFLLPKNSGTNAENVRTNIKYGALAKRPSMLQFSACRSSAVKSIHRFYKSDATKYTIQNSSTFIDSINETTGACTELRSGLTDGKRFQWVTYNDVAIGTNGSDNAIKYDGKTTTTSDTDAARTAGDLVTELGAAFAELNTGSNLTAARWYQYKIAFYDGTTYKYSTARSNPILTGSTVRDIYLTDIPLGPSGTTQRIIYRTAGNTSRANVIADTTYRRVTTISNNTTRVYADTMTDATLAADTAPTWATVSAGINVTPPKAKLSLIHQERLFFANDPSGTTNGKSTIYWSEVFRPDYWNTASEYELIRPDDGDEITFIKHVANILTIGKTNTIQKFYTETNATSGWQTSQPFSFIGSVAMYAATESTTGVYYLGRYGLYLFGGQSSELISDVITDKIKDVSETNIAEYPGIFYDNQYLFSYTSKESGSSYNDRVLILDLVRNSYVIDTKNIDSFALFASDTGILYSGSSSTDGKIYAHSGTFSTLITRYLTDLQAGTADSVYYGGTQEEPYLSLGWDKTWTTVTGAWSAQGSSTWIVKASPGYWYSPITQINASRLDKIYWNEDLGSYGDVTFAIRTGASSGAVSAAAWSSEYSSPSGSDISGLTANSYIQIRAKLTTSNFQFTPYVVLEDSFLAKVTYNRSGVTGETSVASFWKSGYTDLDIPQNPKRIKEIQIHYTGTSGTLTFGYENDEGTSTKTFSVDLSIDPNASRTDQYYGTTTDKVYVYVPPVTDSAVGRKFRFSVTENGTTEWQIRRVVIRGEASPYVTYR